MREMQLVSVLVGLRTNQHTCIFWNKILQLAIRISTEFRPDPARKLSANLYDINHCCVYSEKLLMMDRRTVRNM